MKNKKNIKVKKDSKISVAIQKEWIKLGDELEEYTLKGHKQMSLVEMYNDLHFRHLSQRMKEIATVFINEKICVWCKRDVKPDEMNSIDRLSYLETAICNVCDQEHFTWSKDDPRRNDTQKIVDGINKRKLEVN